MIDLTMLRKLADGEEPYGSGPFDSRHIEIDQRRAQELVAEVVSLRAAVERVRALCDEQMAEGVDGGMVDVDTLWPSVVLRALDGEA